MDRRMVSQLNAFVIMYYIEPELKESKLHKINKFKYA